MVEALYYRDIVKYSEQVERYFSTFGKEQVHVIIFDDFKTDTAGVYRRTLEFLEVEPDFQANFRVIHSSQQVRSTFIRSFLRNPLLIKWGSRFPAIALPINAMIRRFNATSLPRSPIDPDLRRRLQAEFLPEVQRLSELVGRDLTHWCRE